MAVNFMWSSEELMEIKECQIKYRRGLLTYEETLKCIGQVLGFLPGGFLHLIAIPEELRPDLVAIMESRY